MEADAEVDSKVSAEVDKELVPSEVVMAFLQENVEELCSLCVSTPWIVIK